MDGFLFIGLNLFLIYRSVHFFIPDFLDGWVVCLQMFVLACFDVCMEQAERLEEPAEEEDLWDITVSGAATFLPFMLGHQLVLLTENHWLGPSNFAPSGRHPRVCTR